MRAQTYPRIAEESGRDIGWRVVGRVMYTDREERWDHFQTLPELGRARGIDIEVLAPSADCPSPADHRRGGAPRRRLGAERRARQPDRCGRRVRVRSARTRRRDPGAMRGDGHRHSGRRGARRAHGRRRDRLRCDRARGGIVVGGASRDLAAFAFPCTRSSINTSSRGPSASIATCRCFCRSMISSTGARRWAASSSEASTITRSPLRQPTCRATSRRAC